LPVSQMNGHADLQGFRSTSTSLSLIAVDV
jgi:hypothetical protein